MSLARNKAYTAFMHNNNHCARDVTLARLKRFGTFACSVVCCRRLFFMPLQRNKAYMAFMYLPRSHLFVALLDVLDPFVLKGCTCLRAVLLCCVWLSDFDTLFSALADPVHVSVPQAL